MAGFTNKGKMKLLDWAFRNASGQTEKTTFFVALVTSAVTPTYDTNTFGQLTEIAAGGGYTSGGYELATNDTDFPDLNENDVDERGEILAKDVAWTADDDPGIPMSGDGARWAVLTDDNGTVADREVYAFWNLTSDRSVSNGQTLTLQDLELRLTES